MTCKHIYEKLDWIIKFLFNKHYAVNDNDNNDTDDDNNNNNLNYFVKHNKSIEQDLARQ